jgi:Uma2 family endonuclease
METLISTDVASANADADAPSAYRIPAEFEPDISHIITEDDTPVDNILSERQQRLLTQALHSSWKPNKPFIALANVGLFYALRKPPLVPDMLLAVDVDPQKGMANINLAEKSNRSYFIWEYGKPPDVVVEIVSNLKGGELSEKLTRYAEIGVPFYVVFDPFEEYGAKVVHAFALISGGYEPLPEARFERIGLRLQLWKGTFEAFEGEWLRWFTITDDLMLPSAEELQAGLDDEREHRILVEAIAEQERTRANSERERADTERERADTERERAAIANERAEALAQKLRSLGINPDEL